MTVDTKAVWERMNEGERQTLLAVRDAKLANSDDSDAVTLSMYGMIKWDDSMQMWLITMFGRAVAQTGGA